MAFLLNKSDRCFSLGLHSMWMMLVLVCVSELVVLV